MFNYHIVLQTRKIYLLCKVYRLIAQLPVTTEVSSFLRYVKHSHSSIFICREFSINLLSINSNSHFADYFDSVIFSRFFPKITLPTRIQNNSNTSIDQIWSNNFEENIKSKSGIIINNVSGHKMIFIYSTYIEKIHKFIRIERKNQKELKSMKVGENLNQNMNENLDDNYCRFAHLLNNTKKTIFT